MPVVRVDSTAAADPLRPNRLLARLPADTVFAGRLTATSIGNDFHVGGSTGGSACVTEGNATYDVERFIYADTGTSRDMVVRDNYCSDCKAGVDHDFNAQGGGIDAARFAVSLRRHFDDNSPGDPTLAVCITDYRTNFPFLSPGQVVRIARARIPNGDPITAPSKYYNGTFAIIAVFETGSNTYGFTYRMAGNPTGNRSSIGVSGSTRW